MEHPDRITRRAVISAAGGALAAGAALGIPSVEAAAAEAAARTPTPDTPDGLSARHFGAVGDGVADDTDALQKAIEAAFAADDTALGLLVIPPGTYKISRTLRFTQRRNSGQQRIIRAYGARLLSTMRDGCHVIHITSASTWHFIIIEGLEIAGSGEDGHGLYMECDTDRAGLYNFCLRDLVVQGCGADGCRIYGDLFESQLINCAFRNNRGNGAFLAHSPHGGVLSSLHLFGCAFDGNDGHGAEIFRSYDVGFHGCTFTQNGRYGLFASNGVELVLDCRFEDNHRLAFDFRDGGAGMALHRYATLVGCVSHSTANQTHLIDADLSGSFARLVMVGCRASGEGRAAAAGLARLRGAHAIEAVLIGCRGAVVADGFEPLEIGGAGGAIRFAGGWRGANLFRLGTHRLWMDIGGRLRIKDGVPRFDGDGKPVGRPD